MSSENICIPDGIAQEVLDLASYYLTNGAYPYTCR